MASKTERSNNEKNLFNVSELAKAFSRSPNTVKKAIEKNGIKPTKTVGNRIYYHVAEVAPYLVQNKAGVQGKRIDVDRDEVKRAEEIIQIYSSFKEYKEYQTGQLAETNRKIKEERLVEGDGVAIVFGEVIGSIQGYMRRIPNSCEGICPDWTRVHSERLQEELDEKFDAMTRDIREIADDYDGE